MSVADDPFTSENARVIVTGLEAVKGIGALIDRGTFHLQKIYGKPARLEYRQYFGMPGEWRAGFYSEFGFHVRGRAVEPAASRAGAVKATAEAMKGRLPSDPNPERHCLTTDQNLWR